MSVLGPGAACCGEPEGCEVECDLNAPTSEQSPDTDNKDETAETEEDA